MEDERCLQIYAVPSEMEFLPIFLNLWINKAIIYY